jgi:hypothetical protein
MLVVTELEFRPETLYFIPHRDFSFYNIQSIRKIRSLKLPVLLWDEDSQKELVLDIYGYQVFFLNGEETHIMVEDRESFYYEITERKK